MEASISLQGTYSRAVVIIIALAAVDALFLIGLTFWAWRLSKRNRHNTSSTIDDDVPTIAPPAMPIEHPPSHSLTGRSSHLRHPSSHRSAVHSLRLTPSTINPILNLRHSAPAHVPSFRLSASSSLVNHASMSVTTTTYPPSLLSTRALPPSPSPNDPPLSTSTFNTSFPCSPPPPFSPGPSSGLSSASSPPPPFDVHRLPPLSASAFLRLEYSGSDNSPRRTLNFPPEYTV
ncbi:hypothetical protein BV22DRAFT_1134458 [Leucogyrophana mollusca]|uniref:Uncharacterized protein n=1 Tax=Leucogyrophana mollusca TaxID=85980 RepID=A0ACB8AYX6_9AGAM|nr:hypothetical protein BV22DRAFT_1134458 [Leucogyrophana mollusca]